MTAAERIACALGGFGPARNGWFCCDCPVCEGEGKLGLKDTSVGLAVNCFKLCRPTDIFAEIDRRDLLDCEPSDRPSEDPAKIAQRRAAEEAIRRQRIAAARDFIGECRPWNATTQIGRYIRSRGIEEALLSSSILWHGMTSHPEGGKRPLMVGVIEHVDLGVIGASRTFLATDGSQKATFRKPRLFLGLAAGGAVRLGAVHPRIELVIGEGIESTLSYMQLHGLPGWAALSANGIKSLMLPPAARRVVIAADNDLNRTGWKAALAAARRWIFEGRQVRVDMPPAPGTDWNHVLLSGALDHAA